MKENIPRGKRRKTTKLARPGSSSEQRKEDISFTEEDRLSRKLETWPTYRVLCEGALQVNPGVEVM